MISLIDCGFRGSHAAREFPNRFFRDFLFNFRSNFVDALADVALCIFRRGLQPQVIDLRKNAILARHPAIPKYFPPILGTNRRRFLLERGQKFAHRTVERCGREVS